MFNNIEPNVPRKSYSYNSDMPFFSFFSEDRLEAEFGSNPLYFYYKGNGEYEADRRNFEDIEAVNASFLWIRNKNKLK